MKMKQLSALLLVVVLMFALSACGTKAPSADQQGSPDGGSSQSTSDSNDPAALLVGEWTYELGGYTYDFKNDGSGTYKAGETVMNFTYEADGSVLELTYEGVGTPTELEYSIDGKNLNVKDSFGSDTIYEKK